jgi:hypothetical protein
MLAKLIAKKRVTNLLVMEASVKKRWITVNAFPTNKPVFCTGKRPDHSDFASHNVGNSGALADPTT